MTTFSEPVASLRKALERHSRVQLHEGVSPIQRLAGIERALGETLGGLKLYAKRDDLVGPGGGGSKVRKLEYLLGDALTKGADTIIVTGGLQSNSARLAAASAARLGLKAELVLAPLVHGGAEYEGSGNVLLDRLFGAQLRLRPMGGDLVAFAQGRIEALEREGRVPYLLPSGGSSPLGALGYVRVALELDEQFKALGLDQPEIVIANGSSGTHAGLVAGWSALGLPARKVRAFSVLADAEPTCRRTLEMAERAMGLLEYDSALVPTDIVVDDGQLGHGYGMPTKAMIEAVRLMAEQEGLLLDPVYSGKAFAGLLADIRRGRYSDASAVVFLMTGGTPALYAYRHSFLPQPDGDIVWLD